MNGADAGVIGPGREAASYHAKNLTGEDEQRDNDRTGPASAEVGKLGDGLSEDHLVRVALKVAQDRWSEDRRHDDHAKARPIQQYLQRGVGAIQKNFASTHWAEVFCRHGE